MSYTTYAFSFLTPVNVYRNDYIQIDFPTKNFIVPMIGISTFNCTLIIKGTQYPISGFYNSKASIFINISFIDSDIQIHPNQEATFIVDNIRNPRLLLPTDSFVFNLHDQNGVLRAHNFDNFTVQMNQTSDIFNFSIGINNPRIQKLVTYDLKFNLLDVVKPQDKILIKFPTQVNNQYASIITQPFSADNSGSIPDKSNTAFVISNGYASFNSSITLSLQSVFNPDSVQCVSPFQLTFIDSQSNTTYATYTDLKGFCDYQPKLNPVFMLSSKNSNVGEPTTIVFTFIVIMPIPAQGGYFTMTVSGGIAPKGPITCSSPILTMSCKAIEENKILFSGFDSDLNQNANLTITLQGLSNSQNPNLKTANFTINTYDADGHGLEQANYFLHMLQTCNSNCASCGNNYTNCTVCNPGYILFGTDCLLRCPKNYFINGTTCSKCLTPNACLSCNPSKPDQCTNCDTDQLLFQGTCFPNNSDFKQIIAMANQNNSDFINNSWWWTDTSSNYKSNTSNTSISNASNTADTSTASENLNNNQIVNNTSNASNATKAIVKGAVVQEIMLFNTLYDNKPYITGCVLLSLIFLAVNRYLFKNKELNAISCLVFLWCLLDMVCSAFLIIKFILIEHYLYLFGVIFVCCFQLILHIFVSIRLWGQFKKEAEYRIKLESNCCFKFPHLLIFAFNYRCAYILFSGLKNFGQMSPFMKTKPDILKTLRNSLPFGILISFGMIALLTLFIISRILDNEEIPWFFYEYDGFSAIYALLQIVRIIAQNEDINPPPAKQQAKSKPKLDLDFNDINSININMQSPKVEAQPKNIIEKVLATLTSGKKQRRQAPYEIKGKMEISHSPLLPMENDSSRSVNNQNDTLNITSISPGLFNLFNF